MSLLQKLAAAALILSTSTITIAGPALSWNLSRDVAISIKKNPTGVWAFMEGSNLHDPSSYTLLQKFYNPLDTSGNYSISKGWVGNETYFGVPSKTQKDSTGWQVNKNIPFLHTPTLGHAIIRWKSPINGIVTVTGILQDGEICEGTGINWHIDNNTTPLASGTLNDGDGAAFSLQTSVTNKTALYFIINANGNRRCDPTNIDIIITSQQ